MIFIFASLEVLSQPGIPPGGGGDDPAFQGAPFDGGVSLLIAAGIGLGALKLRGKNKIKSE